MRFFKIDKGISLTGYGLIVGLIAVVAITAIGRTGDGVNILFSNVATIMTNAAAGTSSSSGGSGGGGGGGGAPANNPPGLIAGNVINLGTGPFINQDVTLSILALFSDTEGNTPLAISSAATPDGSCITAVNFSLGNVTIDTANSDCSGTILVEVDDSLGATSASTSIQFDVLAASSALFAGGDGTPIGDLFDGGALSVAFDGITSQSYSTGPRKNADGPSFIGKDWGAGVSRVVTRFEMFGSSDLGFANGSGLSESTLEFIVQGSNDNISYTDLFTTPVFTDANGLSIDHSFAANPSTDAYRYHRIHMSVINHPVGKNCCNISELRFYGYQLP